MGGGKILIKGFFSGGGGAAARLLYYVMDYCSTLPPRSEEGDQNFDK